MLQLSAGSGSWRIRLYTPPNKVDETELNLRRLRLTEDRSAPVAQESFAKLFEVSISKPGGSSRQRFA